MADGISVVLCTRNGLRKGFLEETLCSVLGQTEPPAEVILVDDRSTDDTALWVGRRYPQVRVLRNEGAGLAAGRNTGIRSARMPWVAFVDDDDVWRPHKLAAQRAQMERADDARGVIWVAQAATFEEFSQAGPRQIPPQSHFATWPMCLVGNPVFASGALISTELLRKVGPFDENIRFGSAYQIWIRCILAGAEVRYSDHRLVLLRRHAGQMSRASQLRDSVDEVDRMVVPYLDLVSSVLNRRIRWARILTAWRALVLNCGLRDATIYLRQSSLRVGTPGARVLGYFLLDSLARRGPRAASRSIWRFGCRLLTS